MGETIPIQADFAPLDPYLIGTPRQFIVYQDDVYCVRAHPDDLERKKPELNPCQGCPHFEHGCEIAGEFPVESAIRNKDGVLSGMEPHVRRGIGMEARPFLVLAFREGQSHATLPRHLWDNHFADRAMNEANLHFLLTNPKRTKFHTLKGQVRYYGTVPEFEASPYAEYLAVFDDFDPKSHHPISMDKSAIEPRVCTIVTNEPKWLEVFQGSPKVISKEITLAAEPIEDPDYLHRVGDRVFCFLTGELDKVTYGDQCKKCPVLNLCTTKVDHLKNVSGDWHAINAEGFFGAAFTQTSDPYLRKELRGKSKVGGLASIYGGSKFTLSRALNMTEDEAEEALVNFFSTLGVAQQYMSDVRAALQTHGKVETRFGRRRDMTKWSHSQAMKPSFTERKLQRADGSWGVERTPVMVPVQLPDGSWGQAQRQEPDFKKRFKDKNFAERTGLNYPIQGTAAELMKMAMIAINALIQKHGWNPLVGPCIPQWLPVGNRAYLRIIFALLSTVHDELLYLIRTGQIENVIPSAYSAMQLNEVMRSLGTGFTLELDVEYDKYGAWTAGLGVEQAKIYLLNRIAREGNSNGVNTMVVPMCSTSDEFYAAISSQQTTDAVENSLFLAVEQDGKYLYPPGKPRFDREFLSDLSQRLALPVIWAAA